MHTIGGALWGAIIRGREWEYTDLVERDVREDYTENPTDFADGYGISLKEAARAGRRDFDIERWGGEARADWRFVDNGTAILQLGRSSNNGIELTGIGGGQAVDWTYSYYQARMNLGRLFAQTYLNTSDGSSLFGCVALSFRAACGSREDEPLARASRAAGRQTEVPAERDDLGGRGVFASAWGFESLRLRSRARFKPPAAPRPLRGFLRMCAAARGRA